MSRLCISLVSGLLLCLGATAQTTSHYVPMKDGTRIAVDVHRPAELPEDGLPALLEMTRYWRGAEDPETGAPRRSLSSLDRYFQSGGYVIVKVDVRGSGASFGTRPVEYGPREVKDLFEVVAWVVEQPWCDGSIGAYGTSYTGTTAELLSASGHPAVKAVVPGWSDFETYTSPIRPYGLLASDFLGEWSRLVGAMDRNDAQVMGGHVRRVDADVDGSLRARAVEEHRRNPPVLETIRAAPFRDDRLAGSEHSYEAISPLHWKEAIERSKVPMLVLVSWMDAGTAEGAIQRFQHFSNPQHLVLMATSHGGFFNASPFRAEPGPRPTVPEQFAMQRDFFDHHLKSAHNGVSEWPKVRYYNLGEEAFKETDVWPPAGTKRRTWYFGNAGRLEREAALEEAGSDRYRVDFGVSTGGGNRWMTQMGRPIFGLEDRTDVDSRMLTYTSPPLEADLQITGTPRVTLHITSDHEDGAFLVYLEVVDLDGRSRYVTEGGLRAIHRKLSAHPVFETEHPYHSFKRADALPLEPGEPAELTFTLWPISVQVKKGQRLRVAIAGADASSFDRIPEEGDPTLEIWRAKSRPSHIDLPIVE